MDDAVRAGRALLEAVEIPGRPAIDLGAGRRKAAAFSPERQRPIT